MPDAVPSPQDARLDELRALIAELTERRDHFWPYSRSPQTLTEREAYARAADYDAIIHRLDAALRACAEALAPAEDK